MRAIGLVGPRAGESEDELVLTERDGLRPDPERIRKSDERAWLREPHGDLRVPITGSHDAVLGMVVLGEKRSELPYTAGDQLLVQALAQQAGVIGDNLRLFRRVGDERRSAWPSCVPRTREPPSM